MNYYEMSDINNRHLQFRLFLYLVHSTCWSFCLAISLMQKTEAKFYSETFDFSGLYGIVSQYVDLLNILCFIQIAISVRFFRPPL
jgi:hypothetical protein